MKERIVTLGLALGAFVLFYMLFVPKPQPQGVMARPISTEIRGAGYQALWRWLRAQGIRVESWRNRYDQLGSRDAATGNILVTTMPQQFPARADELQDLHAWLERGNTLLVMAALDDTPAWALRAGNFSDLLTRMTGLAFQVIPEKKQDEAAGSTRTARSVRQALQQLIEPKRGSIVARGSHPLFAGIASVATESEYPASRWRARSKDAASVLEIGERTDLTEPGAAAEPAVWLRRHGQGQVIVLAYASPFSNALIGQQDNARLFANIVAWSRAGNGAVLFDDAHQGLVNYYDAKAFFADSRLHRTLLWLCALWLLFVLGWQRLRPHTDGWHPVDVTSFIKVTGGLFASRVHANLVGLRLCENFFNSIRQRLALPLNGLPVWEWLDTQASISASDVAHLRKLHARAQTGQRIDLIRLQNCLTKITGNLK